MLGYSAFTTLRYPVNPLAIEDHFKRLAENAVYLGLKPIESEEELYKALQGLPFFTNTAQKHYRLRLTAFLEGADLAGLKQNNPPYPTRYWVSVSQNLLAPLPKLPLAPTSVLQSQQYQHAMPTIKHGSLAPSWFLQAKTGENPVLWLNNEGFACETTTANLLGFVDAQTLWLAPEGMALAGITQSQCLKIANQLGFKVEKFPKTLSELKKMPGLVLSNSINGLQAVKQVDETQLLWPKPVWERYKQLYGAWLSYLSA